MKFDIKHSSLNDKILQNAFLFYGDKITDIFSFLSGDWPERGGDARLSQPVSTYAGGSSTNTTTHLNNLLREFHDDGKGDNKFNASNKKQLILHTVLNTDDQYGNILLNHAKQCGFQLFNCKQDDDTSSTGHCIAIVDGQERSFMTYLGCVENFRADHLDREQIIHSDTHIHLHIAGYFNLTGFQDGQLKDQIELIRNQRKGIFPDKTTTISLVPQHDATNAWDRGLSDVIPLLDFLILNDMEAKNIVQHGRARVGGVAKEEEDEKQHREEAVLLEDWATYFQEISPRTCVVVTRGALGAVALVGGEIVASQAATPVKIIDPTGAGDAFTAGFLHGLWFWCDNQQQQKPSSTSVISAKSSTTAPTTVSRATDSSVEWPIEAIKQALLWGCVIGTSSVLVRGASVPFEKADIEQIYRETEKMSLST